MKILLIVTCLANIAFAFGTLPWMPDQIAVHFGPDGSVNRFESPIASAALMSVLACIITGVVFKISFMTSFLALNAPDSFNMPNSDYWLNEENRSKTIRRFCSWMELIGVLTMLFLLLVSWELFRVNQTVPPGMPNIDVMVYGGSILSAVFVFETVRLLLAFRLPKEQRRLDESAITTTITSNEKPKGDDL